MITLTKIKIKDYVDIKIWGKQPSEADCVIVRNYLCGGNKYHNIGTIKHRLNLNKYLFINFSL